MLFLAAHTNTYIIQDSDQLTNWHLRTHLLCLWHFGQSWVPCFSSQCGWHLRPPWVGSVPFPWRRHIEPGPGATVTCTRGLPQLSGCWSTSHHPDRKDMIINYWMRNDTFLTPRLLDEDGRNLTKTKFTGIFLNDNSLSFTEFLKIIFSQNSL